MTEDRMAEFHQRVAELSALTPTPTEIADVLRSELTAEEKAGICDAVMARLVGDYLRLSRDLRRGFPTAPLRKAGPSKAHFVAEWYRGWLAQSLAVGPNPGDYKTLGECTFQDLMFAAATRREQASRLSAIADNLEGIAALLQHHRVDRVADLPRDAVETFRRGGAAA